MTAPIVPGPNHLDVPPLPADPHGWPKWLVGLARGAAEAIVLAVIGWAVVALGDVTSGTLAPWAPLAVLALRQLEGVADHLIDPAVQRAGGGGPA